jgi:hypothetical protein
MVGIYARVDVAGPCERRSGGVTTRADWARRSVTAEQVKPRKQKEEARDLSGVGIFGGRVQRETAQ